MTLYHACEGVTEGCDHRHADPDRARVGASLDRTLSELGDDVDSYALGTVQAGSVEEALARMRAGPGSTRGRSAGTPDSPGV